MNKGLRNKMLKGEIDILKSVALGKCRMKQIISGRNIRDNMYAISTFDSMIKDGLIQESKYGEYTITPKGLQALLKISKKTDILSKESRSKLLHQYSESTRNNKQLSGFREQTKKGAKRGLEYDYVR
jgi:predicted transcriptional regulator